MTTIHNILMFPFFILQCVVDIYICLLVTRLLLRSAATSQAARATTLIQDLTDPLAFAVQRRLSAWKGKPVPGWAAWTALCVGIWIVRSLLASLAAAVH